MAWRKHLRHAIFGASMVGTAWPLGLFDCQHPGLAILDPGAASNAFLLL